MITCFITVGSIYVLLLLIMLYQFIRELWQEDTVRYICEDYIFLLIYTTFFIAIYSVPVILITDIILKIIEVFSVY